MSKKFNLGNELKGYKNWLLDNKKGFVITVASTTIVVSVIGAGFGIIPLNNAKNTAQGNYQRVLTRFNEIKEEKYTLGQKIEELETKVNDLEKEKLGLQAQLEQPAEEEDTEEAEEPEEVTEEQAEITPYIPTMEDEQALISAQQYLDLGFGFSREGMRQQLEYEGFSDTAIGYALDSLY